MGICASESRYWRRAEELELHVVLCCPKWELETELGSRRAATNLTYPDVLQPVFHI